MKKKKSKLKIYFKNVHNGDSILMEWMEGEKRNFGIIDCALSRNGLNPIVEHLKHKNQKEIGFVVSSHPHTDHYMGFFDLFDYCEDNNASIDVFFHTAGFGAKNLISFLSKGKETREEKLEKVFLSPVNTDLDKNCLFEFFKVLLNQGEISNGFIKEVRAITNDYMEISITEDIKIKFFAPVWEYELQKYLNKVSEINEDKITLEAKKDKNNTIGNLLSTFILIEHKNFKILLTSDINKDVFRRVIKNKKFNSEKIKICQLPHHGSELNFHEEDWIGLIKNQSDVSYIMSAGNRYQHPGYDVVSYFAKHPNTKGIFCTNFVNGFEKYFKKSNFNINNNFNINFSNIDFFTLSEHFESRGDVIISVDDNGKYEIIQNEKKYN